MKPLTAYLDYRQYLHDFYAEQKRHLHGFNSRANRLCNLTPDVKAWLLKQDSILTSIPDPYTWPPNDSSWESTQKCPPP